MTDEALSNPHDVFFKATFSRPEVVRDFLGCALPAEVLNRLDLDSLELTKDSHVDEQLRSSHSDLLYRVTLCAGAGDGMVYLLFEHKSAQDRMTVFQLLRYVVRIWEQQCRQQQNLCPIIPLVVYHGSRNWSAPRSLRQLVESPDELSGYVPDFAIQLCDLSVWSDEQLKGAALTRAVLLTLKYIARDELAERLPDILRLFGDLICEPDGLACLVTLLTYVSAATDQVDKDQLTIAVRQNLGRAGEELMPTIAQQWRKEALEEGREEGREEGLRAGILAVLELRFSGSSEPIVDRLSTFRSADSLTKLLELSKSAATATELLTYLDRASRDE